MQMRKDVLMTLALSAALASGAMAAPTLITGIESDTKGAAFPPAADGEWAGFGASLADFAINTDVADVAAGAQSLEISATWASWGMGISYNVAGAAIDISSGPGVSYMAKQDAANNNTLQFRALEGDGDIWLSAGSPLSTSFQKVYADMSTATIDGGSTGDGTMDLTNITEIGFIILSNGSTGTTIIHIDEIYYDDAAPTATPPDLPVVTSMEPPDQTASGFPPDPVTGGTEGEWTRFGAAYNGILLVNNAANASDGDYYLQVSANWPAGSRVGVRHKPYNAPADWSSYVYFEYDVMATAVNNDTTHQFAMFETDGDIWVSANMPVADSYQTESLNFASDLTLDVASTGDGSLSLSSIELWGLNFDNSQFTGLQDFHVDNAKLTNISASIADWMMID
jgi:hypothetical protein